MQRFEKSRGSQEFSGRGKKKSAFGRFQGTAGYTALTLFRISSCSRKGPAAAHGQATVS